MMDAMSYGSLPTLPRRGIIHQPNETKHKQHQGSKQASSTGSSSRQEARTLSTPTVENDPSFRYNLAHLFFTTILDPLGARILPVFCLENHHQPALLNERRITNRQINDHHRIIDSKSATHQSAWACARAFLPSQRTSLIPAHLDERPTCARTQATRPPAIFFLHR
jgi:hypothetical protein